jgi:AcrR family transcriptional regulator
MTAAPAWTQQRTEKREAVLRQAAALFAERGYAAVSMSDLAERLQMTKPTLYYYFRSKDEMLLAVKRRGLEEIYSAIDAAYALRGTGLERLQSLFLRYTEIMASDFGRCLITVNRSDLDPAARRKVQGEEKAGEERILRLFAEGMSDGSIKTQDVKIAYQAVFGMLNWIAVWYKDHGPVGRDQMIAQVTSLVLDGIRGPAG